MIGRLRGGGEIICAWQWAEGFTVFVIIYFLISAPARNCTCVDGSRRDDVW
jgi:hypothetical protein